MKLINSTELETTLEAAIKLQEEMAAILDLKDDEGIQAEIKAYKDILKHVKELQEISSELTSIFFSCDDYKMITDYQKEIEAVSPGVAVMNAISLALDDREITPHDKRMELRGALVDDVEDWLELKGIKDLPNEDHDQAGDDNCAIIYGEDYDNLANMFEKTLILFGLIEKER